MRWKKVVTETNQLQCNPNWQIPMVDEINAQRHELLYKEYFDNQCSQYEPRQVSFWLLFDIARGYVRPAYRLDLIYHAWIISSLLSSYQYKGCLVADYVVSLLLSAATHNSNLTEFCLALTEQYTGLSVFYHQWGMKAFLKFVDNYPSMEESLTISQITSEHLLPVLSHWCRVIVDSWWTFRDEWYQSISDEEVNCMFFYIAHADALQKNQHWPIWTPVIYRKVLKDITSHIEPLDPPYWYRYTPIPSLQNFIVAAVFVRLHRDYHQHYLIPNKIPLIKPNVPSLVNLCVYKINRIWIKTYHCFNQQWMAKNAFERHRKANTSIIHSIENITEQQ
jgi:hypothetical protein